MMDVACLVTSMKWLIASFVLEVRPQSGCYNYVPNAHKTCFETNYLDFPLFVVWLMTGPVGGWVGASVGLFAILSVTCCCVP